MYGFRSKYSILILKHKGYKMSIENNTFDDKEVKLQRLSNENCLWFQNNNKEVFMSKNDVIAMAKHFKLTSDDLL